MTKSRLPDITLTCRNSHQFQTKAQGGATVRCPTCKAPKHVPNDRPRTSREVDAINATSQDHNQAPDGQMAARWENEPEWSEQSLLAPSRAGDQCSECDGPLRWEPGRTLTYCHPCQQVDLPAAVYAHYERQAGQQAKLAARDAPDEAASRAARVRLRAMAARMTNTVNDWINDFDPDGLNGGAERLALDYQAELTAWLPEIRQAASEAELADIAAEITAITNRAANSGDSAVIERHRQTAEQQQETAARDRRAETERQQQAETMAAGPEPAAIERGPGPTGTAAAALSFAGMIEQYRQERARLLATHGTCDFRHRKPVIAERLYGIQFTGNWHGGGTGQQVTGTAQVRACAKHFPDADEWIGKAMVPAGAGTCYWELGP